MGFLRCEYCPITPLITPKTKSPPLSNPALPDIIELTLERKLRRRNGVRVLKLLLGILLLAIGIMIASNVGNNAGGGNKRGATIPIGTVKVEYSVNGK